MSGSLSGTEIIFCDPLRWDGSPGPIKLQTTTGAIAALGDSRMAYVQDYVTPLMVEENDYTVAVRAAVATGRPVHFPPYALRITDMITWSTPGQQAVGYGTTISQILVDASFNVEAMAVFNIAPATYGNGIKGPQFFGIGIVFSQPNSGVLSGLITYPTAWLVNNAPRTGLWNVRAQTGTNGILFLGDCGGSEVYKPELSCFVLNLSIDGCQDTMWLTNLDIWPHGMTALQALVFYAMTCTGVLSGRCDDLRITSGRIFCGQTLHLITSVATTGNTFGSITDLNIDTFGGVWIQDGDISFTGGQIGVSPEGGITQVYGLRHSGGNARFTGTKFIASAPISSGFLMFSEPSGATGGGVNVLSMDGVQIAMEVDATALAVTGTGATLNISGGTVEVYGTPSSTMVLLDSGSGVIDGLDFVASTATGSAVSLLTCIAAGADLAYDISGNAGGMRAYIPYPSTILRLEMENLALGVSGSGTVDLVVTPVRMVQMRGNLDSSGSAVVAHGLVSASYPPVRASAVYFNNTGAAVPLGINSVDGTNVTIDGGSGLAGLPFQINLDYIQNQRART